METLLFWALPITAALVGLKSRMMTGWRLFLSSMIALYVGVWCAPAWWGLLDFLPAELVPYRKALAISVSAVALFVILYKTSTALAPASHNETYVFPKLPEMFLNVCFHFGFGLALSTFAFVLCCATPVKMSIRNNGEGMRQKASSALLRITAVADKLTMSTPKETPRAAMIDSLELWYEPSNEGGEDKAGEDGASAPAADKGAAAKDLSEKNAAPPTAPKSPVPAE